MNNSRQGESAGAVDASIEVRPPQGNEELERYYDLRWRILRQPWSQSRGGERDEHEKEAIHIAAWLNGNVVGVGRVHITGPGEAQIRYMAVETDMQGRSVGSKILSELEQRAMAVGARKIMLNARDRAVQFYTRHGYKVTRESDVLFDAIPHWQMEKLL